MIKTWNKFFSLATALFQFKIATDAIAKAPNFKNTRFLIIVNQ
jgi:hypothetical protein